MRLLVRNAPLEITCISDIILSLCESSLKHKPSLYPAWSEDLHYSEIVRLQYAHAIGWPICLTSPMVLTSL